MSRSPFIPFVDVPRELDRGACVGAPDPDIFYPATAEQRSEALAVCGTCPVVDACLTLGRAGKHTGVWGGQLLLYGEPAKRLLYTDENLETRPRGRAKRVA